jgi:hypothetical protein
MGTPAGVATHSLDPLVNAPGAWVEIPYSFHIHHADGCTGRRQASRGHDWLYEVK